MELPETSTLIAALTSAAWKGAVVLVVAGVVAMFAARRSAAARHLVWCSAMLALIAIPFLGMFVPTWTAELPLRSPAPRAAATETPEAVLPPSRLDASSTPAPASTADSGVNAALQPAATPPATAESVSSEPAGGFLSSVELPPLSSLVWMVWLLGACMVLADILAGHFLARRTTRRARRVSDTRILAALHDVAHRLDLNAPVDVRTDESVSVPCTWGVLQPSLLLPEDVTEWSDERLRMVLTHELGHVKRCDWLTQVLAHVACAIHWFNPLAWIARRNVIREQEAATDDLVLNAGDGASAYATNLLDIARASVQRRNRFATLSTATIAMSRRSTLEGRLLAILDPNRKRSAVYGRRVLTTGLLVSVFLLPLAAMQPTVVEQRAGSVDDAMLAAGLPTDDSANDEHAVFDTEARYDQGDPVPNANGDNAGVAERVFAGRSVKGTSDRDVDHAASLEMDAESEEDRIDAAALDTTKVIALLDALRNESDAEVRTYLIRILGELDDRRATAGMTEVLLNDDSEQVRESAAWALGELDDPAAVPALGRALSSDASLNVRRHAAWALGEIGSDEAAAQLENALTNDAATEVREYAAWALGEIESASSVEALERALSDEDAQVRLKAAWALGEIESERSAAALTRLLSDSSAEVRKYAAHALAEIGSADAVDALTTAVDDPDQSVRESAIYALGEIGSPAATNALTRALQDEEEDVRARAAWALAEIRSTEATDALIGALDDESAEVRRHVARALGEIGANRASDALLNMIRNDPDAEVRKMAAAALSELDF